MPDGGPKEKSWLFGTDENFGQKMENSLATILVKYLQTPEIKEDGEVPPKIRFAFRRATKDEDSDGIDFWFYLKRKGEEGKWYPVDLTTTNNDDELAEKRKKERDRGILMLRLEARTIELAERGAEKDTESISEAIVALFEKQP